MIMARFEKDLCMKPEFLAMKLVLRQWVSKDVNSRKQQQKKCQINILYSDGSSANTVYLSV